MRSFFLFKRKRSPNFFAQFLDSDGNKIAQRSLGTNKRDEALLLADQIHRTGQIRPTKTSKQAAPTLAAVLSYDQLARQLKTMELTPDQAARIVALLAGRGLLSKKDNTSSRDFCEFLIEFWDYHKSPYVKEKQAAGQRIGERHCQEKTLQVKARWTDFFKGRTIGSITRQDLKAFLISFAGQVSPTTAGKILLTGTVALKWAFENDLISNDPTVGIKKPTAPAAHRGILTDDELTKLFSIQWKDERARIAALLSATTGMRQAEIVALRIDDIQQDRITISNSWGRVEGIKDTKTGETRQAVLLPEVRQQLLSLHAKNPHGDGFIFYSANPGVPYSGKSALAGFIDAVEKIGIDNETRKTRKIDFHSFRHGAAKRLADRVNERTLKLAGGWKTTAVADRYADHRTESDFKSIIDATTDAFSNILTFPREAAQ
jgi:integrase